MVMLLEALADDKETLITISKENGLGEGLSLWTTNFIGAQRTVFELDWQKTED